MRIIFAKIYLLYNEKIKNKWLLNNNNKNRTYYFFLVYEKKIIVDLGHLNQIKNKTIR
jgi:hypothetical protein